ncbi:cobalt-precorrin 5A hydrolase [Anaerocolumna sp. AGMB13025]|uniref:cobalt-precorrin 5A hydrolase n=1 Tax=Anaerocolumna sp. AGMB13025 TaxID=3039116 RepID=UPI00241F5788|nr:cobalt-precorrin 5A hydrolase [Anaerocolumna sp. AGMB13025]WFR56100.1 cobalt-precorrin 5A hydrolase [Anaerocolumna sp. AGMB13025]
MKISVISFTKNGQKLNETICQGFTARGRIAEGYTYQNYVSGTGLRGFSSLKELMEQIFYESHGIIFIGACGIAVRAIAPFIKSKAEDPGVAVAGEDAKYVISLLSGHLGGANELSRETASIIGAEPVITTATDINNSFAVDNWAVKNNLLINDLAMVKVISGTVLNQETVGFYSEYPIEGSIPPELDPQCKAEVGICVYKDASKRPFTRTLNLIPRNIVLGIGCRKDTEAEIISSAVQDLFSRHTLLKSRIFRICSIDIKKEEKGILLLSQLLQAEYMTFSVDELKRIQGQFHSSEFVEKTVGVDNVCERSASLGSNFGKQLIPKTLYSGVTLAVYEREYKVSF